ncbi:MAG: PQQ-dependent sugar dehydrogenase [Vicinamibacterales bacterium]
MKFVLSITAAALLALVATSGSGSAQAPAAPAPAPGAPPAQGARPGGPPPGPQPIPGVANAADPFPTPIPATEGVINVNVREFASLPDIDGVAARMMQIHTEPGTKRLMVNDQRGIIYRLSEDGRQVSRYLDLNEFGAAVQSTGRERGFQSFALHPQFNQQGARGFGKFYTYSETSNMTPTPDFKPKNATTPPTNHSVLLEWTARTPGAARYDGDNPRELMRWEDPFQNHNGGMMSFNPLAQPNAPDYGMLYLGVADGGSGGDPLNMAQDLGIAFGKIFRIDPLGNNSPNKKYGIPADNPMRNTAGALPEIYASGVRNPQRFAWDSRNGAMFMSDIGQNIVEEISPVTPGANLGWNVWEGSYKFLGNQGGVQVEGPRTDPRMTYPIVEYGQIDPLLQGQSAAGGLAVYRGNQVPQLANLLIFADMPSGEIFYVNADRLPSGGQSAIRRILVDDGSGPKTFLQVVQRKNTAQGKMPATRADLRFNTGPDNQVFLLNKADGTIRVFAR